MGQRPRSIRFVQNGAKAYVTNEVAGTVTVVDMNAQKTVKTITMPQGSTAHGAGGRPDGQKVYVSNGRGGTLSVLDVATDSILSTTKVGTRPWGVGVTKDGKKLYTGERPRQRRLGD